MSSRRTELDEAFQTAVELSDEGRHEEAARVLEAVLADRLERRPRLAAAHAKLGHLYLSKLGRPADAEPHFRRSVRLSPSSELASLGLFHALAKQGKTDEAFAEMRRFTARKPSPEYQKLLAEINAGGPSDDDG